jgi:coenzyme F420 biosynthesis associated uncharacterized protein
VIDWILAGRLAGLVAGSGENRPPAGDLDALAADARERVARYTGLTPTRPLPAPELIGRRAWIDANVSSMRRLLDPVLERAMEKLPSSTVRPAVSLTVSVVSTVEVGVVLGYMAQRVLGQYELVMLEETPDDRPPRLLFVGPNLALAVDRLDVPADEFLTWVTLHEVTHAVQFAGVPWLQSYLAGLVSELLRTAELRMDRPRGASSRRGLPGRAELRRISAAVRRGDIVGLVASPAERETLDRVQAAMAVVEGHAEHVMDAVAPELLPSLPRLRSALDRRRRSQSGLSRIFGKLLGLELKLRQYEQGKAFCDAAVAAAGPEALTRMFDSPETLPTLAEIDDPDAWVRRMGLSAELSPTTGP